MAKLQPPLAEVRAAVSRVNRTTSAHDAKRSDHAGRSYMLTVKIDPEDVANVDAFLNGPMGSHQIVLRFLTLEQGWAAPKCDPNISPEEAVMDDELALLRAQHVDLLAAMTGRGPKPAPDSATA